MSWVPIPNDSGLPVKKKDRAAYTEGVKASQPRIRSLLLTAPMLLAAIVAICASTPAWAQDENSSGPCPCFSYEEVEGVFRSAEQLLASGGGGSCQASDYGVEFQGDVVVTDANYSTIARAGISWSDYDPGRCDYRDTSVEPQIERNYSWPYPAPEGPPRACLDIISTVISKLDSKGRCHVYP